MNLVIYLYIIKYYVNRTLIYMCNVTTLVRRLTYILRRKTSLPSSAPFETLYTRDKGWQRRKRILIRLNTRRRYVLNHDLIHRLSRFRGPQVPSFPRVTHKLVSSFKRISSTRNFLFIINSFTFLLQSQGYFF